MKKYTPPTISVVQRRQLLRALGIGFAALGLGAHGLALSSDQSTRKLMRAIPGTDLRIPAIGLGTARTFSLVPLPTRQPPRLADLDVPSEELAALREVLRVFHAEGGRLVDSSPMYGAAEELVGRFAKELDLLDDLLMATKVWTDGREEGIRQMQTSMKLMHRQPMDIMLIHNLQDWRTQYQNLRQLQDAGQIRYIGVSHSRSDAHGEVERVLREERFDVLQINYNAMDSHADQRLLPYCQDEGLATLINVPFGNGQLFRHTRGHELPAWAAEFDAESWAQVFLKFIISHPAVTCAIPATSNSRHVRDNTRAMYGRLPNDQQRREIQAYLQSL